MEEFFARVWTNLIGRTEGPMHVAPPASTAGLFIFAIRSGLGDARENKPPFLLSQTFNLDRYQLRRQAWKDIGKLLIAATILDMVYQVIALHWIYPCEAVMSSDPSGNAPVKLDTGTKLAYERTFPAYERTAMAWVRTTLTFITFGFTISKFFEYMRERNGAHATVLPSIGRDSHDCLGTDFHGYSDGLSRTGCAGATQTESRCASFSNRSDGHFDFFLGISAMLGASLKWHKVS